MQKNTFLATVVGLAAVIAVSGTFLYTKFFAGDGESSGPGGKGGRGGRGGGDTVVSVRTMDLAVTTLHGYISTNGDIESQNQVAVYPDIGGKIVSSNVLLGSPVRKGQILAYVDPSEPGSYYRASAVYSPISGSVITTPVKNGTKVTTSTAITTIGDINNLQVSADVPERYVGVLKVGLKAKISVEAYPDTTFDATVFRVSPVVDSTSRTKNVILHFDERDSRINAGMFAKVILYTEDYEGAVVMPATSVVQNGDKYYAYAVNDDSTVSKREVTLGKNVDGMVQLLSGVSEGEKIVIQGQTSLADGSKIKDIGAPKSDSSDSSNSSASESFESVGEKKGERRSDSGKSGRK
ncbi:efflux RND transporter periplasmic adaptor subunit [Treponema zioleckii]|uniref:efflux RND transporter periplasmic adaptor subunit n=1 Tax=Treponema zioleckii TaxID=331680 RepID=UPI001F5BBF99|nr:efflux RND transporter periplasmic adaptor subunit [Treponema zioleckii]